MITSAISSAVDASAFLTTSRVIGSTRSAIELDLYVAERVQAGRAAGRDDAGRVRLVDEERAAPLALEQAGTVADGCLHQALSWIEEGEPGSREVGQSPDRGEGVVLPRRGALDARERPDRHDVDRVGSRAVTVRPNVLRDEVRDETGDIEGAGQNRHWDLGRLTCV